MNKFAKRLKKSIGNVENILVVGEGFGHLEILLEIANTVFVVNKERPNIKSKKLVYRENFDDLTPLHDISAIFIDRKQIHELPKLAAIWQRYKSVVCIEDPVVISRDISKPLFNSHYEATIQQEKYHIWTKKK